MTPATISTACVELLPEPVARSLRHSGVIGRPVPSKVSVSQNGEILLRGRWLPFVADETYTLDPPSFRWAATVKLAGLPLARASDTFADGNGRMHVRVLGLFTVVDESGPEMDQGALMRWLNETMWFPHVWATDVISWTPVDDTTAIGSVTAGDVTVEAEFCFDDDGRLVDFHGDRYRIDDSGKELLRWSTPLDDHERFDGVEVPSTGRAEWNVGGEYIRLRVTGLRFG